MAILLMLVRLAHELRLACEVWGACSNVSTGIALSLAAVPIGFGKLSRGLIVSTLLAGCAINNSPAPNRYEMAIQGFDAAERACTSVAATIENLRRAFQCITDAENAHIRSLHPYSDLLDLKHARRMALVSRVERRQITTEDATVELATLNAEIMAEVQRRLNSDRTARA